MSVVRVMRQGVREGVRGVVDLFFPKQCMVNDEPLEGNEFHFSQKVREGIARLALVGYCRRCGSSVGPNERHDRANPCGRCAERDLGIHTIARIGAFEQPLRRLVYRLKFAGQWELAVAAGPLLAQALRAVMEESAVKVDALVPLPLHWRRKLKRGFNQAEELANSTGRILGVNVLRPLRRIKATHEQATLMNRTQRRENMAGAFVARADGRLHGKHVWLLDDVCTTGATLHAAATALRKLAPEIRPASINALVLCVTDSKAPVQVVELDGDEVEGEDVAGE